MTSFKGATTENEDGTKEYTTQTDFRAESGILSVVFPAGTKIKGVSAWSGEFNTPSISDLASEPSQTGYTAHMGTGYELGFPTGKLILDKSAKITMTGEAGKRVGYTRPGESFTEITTACGANTQVWADANLGTEGDCKIDVGSDLVVWTKHFTQFATFTMTQNSTGGGNNTSSDGGIAYGPLSVGYVRTYPVAVAVASPVITNNISTGTVAMFVKDLARGQKGDDIKKLQELLSKDKTIYPEGIINGSFGPLTEKAVKAFQKKYGISQVGRVGPLTRNKLNEVFGGAPVPKVSSEKVLSIEEQIANLRAKIDELMKHI